MIKLKYFLLGIILISASIFIPSISWASETIAHDYTNNWAGYLSVALFIFAYVLVIFEETIKLRKSKPVIAVAGAIWLLVAYVYGQSGYHEEASKLLRENFLEYSELAFFLLSAMTYINTIAERNVFQALRVKLVNMGFSYRALFWITGLMAFLLSPIADNLTTALVLGAVVMAVGVGNPKFIGIACINIVVAANAGGAFSPFGDITTLMVWQKGVVHFFDFFELFIPSLLSWLVPAIIMSLSIKSDKSPEAQSSKVKVKKGGYFISVLFLITVAMTVTIHNSLNLPPFLGMMTGLGLLMIFSYFIRQKELKCWEPKSFDSSEGFKHSCKPFDIFVSIKRVEWDTLIFFYGIILSVGGLSALGYLTGLSNLIYEGLGATWANILVGVISAIIDNIPVMFAVLTMNPDMSQGQWLLVTLTAGIGGSLLSIGSAAGVALMGQARGVYTFASHLKWSWAVALGYAVAIWAHLLLNNMN